MTGMMTCKELYDFLAEFLEGNLSEEQMRVTKKHLEHCPCCKHYLDNYGEAMQLGKSVCSGDLGEETQVEVPESLIQTILAAQKNKSN
ncbi:MAG: anti-sigma factor family protein [Pirellulales bacterium]